MDVDLSDKEQWEWIKEQVRENAGAVLLALVVVGAALLGWRWWHSREDARQLEAGGRYMQMVQSLEHGDRTQALVLLGELERGASLPSGAPASLRARSREGRAQLGLFEAGGAASAPPHPALETLRAVDVDRLTPLDALQLVATLKRMAQDK